MEDIFISGNLFEGNPETDLNAGDNVNANHIFIANQAPTTDAGAVRGLKIYGNVFTHAHGSSIKIENAENILIAHNNFDSVNPSLSNMQAHVYINDNKRTDRHPKNIRVFNNIFYSNMPPAVNNNFFAVKYDQDWASEITIDHNLYYGVAGIRSFAIAGASPWAYRLDDWDAYRVATGQDGNSPEPADPLWQEPALGNYLLSAESPAINAGMALEEVFDDFSGHPFDEQSPSIGAYEH